MNANATRRSGTMRGATRTGSHTTKEQIQKALRIQQQQIDLLKRENDDLRAKYEYESKVPPSTKPKGVQFKELQALEKQGHTTQAKINEAKEQNDKLRAEINTLAQQVRDQRGQVRGAFSTKDSDDAVATQIKILEARLDKALSKYNAAVAENKELRARIDNMRCERVVFDGVYKKMEKKLFEKKKEMASIIEEANVCYEERNAFEDEMKSLRTQQDQDRAFFEKRCQELDQKILQEDNTMDAAFTDQMLDEGGDDQSVGYVLQEAAEEQAISQLTNEKLQAYEEAVWRIRNATGMQSIDDLVWRYQEVEDQIVTNNNIIGDLEVQIQRLEKEEREDRDAAFAIHSRAEDERGEFGKEMTENMKQLESRKQKIETFKGNADGVTQNISRLFPFVSGLFKTAECEEPEDANADNSITISNIVSYLGQIESKVNDLRASFLAAYPSLLNQAPPKATSSSPGGYNTTNRPTSQLSRKTRPDEEEEEEEGTQGEGSTKRTKGTEDGAEEEVGEEAGEEEAGEEEAGEEEAES
ncbi:putative Outer dynein arm protein 1 [Blattamonas nauphoetae]|uniref:Outer dynein arm protein 1 n=1 Tax=Blattamonas nauphoetae TaxID=2049346 RepID=A0ABQ9YFN5_9EUKA|nr:putative Outer dynein arm protein 1 [Blattamonas nauphoetae]